MVLSGLKGFSCRVILFMVLPEMLLLTTVVSKFQFDKSVEHFAENESPGLVVCSVIVLVV